MIFLTKKMYYHHYFVPLKLCLFIINLPSSLCLSSSNATESLLEYSPISHSYLSGAGSHGYYAGAMPGYAWNMPYKSGGHYPIDPWKQNRYDYWENADLYARQDYYWLIPVAFIIGIGALLLPVVSLFITAMITTGTINLTAGRKKRSPLFDQSSNLMRNSDTIKTLTDLMVKAQLVLKRFGHQK